MLKVIAIILGLLIIPSAKGYACEGQCSSAVGVVASDDKASCCEKTESEPVQHTVDDCPHESSMADCLCGCVPKVPVNQPVSVPVQHRNLDFQYDVLVKILTLDELNPAGTHRQMAYAPESLISGVESPRYLINNVFRI